LVYQIEVTKDVEKTLKSYQKKIQPKQFKRLGEAISGLATDPMPQGCESVKNSEGLLRIRVGDYRIIYQVEDNVLTVVVVRIGHRREIYRDF
jgi:mRNA interferase RelE/StbE